MIQIPDSCYCKRLMTDNTNLRNGTNAKDHALSMLCYFEILGLYDCLDLGSTG